MTEKGNMGQPWEYRLTLWLPGPPVVGAIIIAVCLIAAHLGFVWLFGLQVHIITFLMALLIAYLLVLPRYLNSRYLLDRQQYRPEVPLSSERKLEIQSLCFRHDIIKRSRWAGAFGVLVTFTINEVAAYFEGADLIEMFMRVHDGTAILPLTLFLGWVIMRFIYFSRTTDHELPLPESSMVDLLNLKNLYAIGRTGLRRALVDLVAIGIAGILGLKTVFGLWATVPVFVIGLFAGLVVLLRPARKVRNLIREVKQKELARLEPLLRSARDDVLSGDGSLKGRLTDLLAYQSRIESISEWPFDSSTLLRFGLYLLIPVGSMVGGALVERLIDMLFS